MRTSTRASFTALAFAASFVTGCSLIAAPDESLLTTSSQSAGGSGGTGGANVTASSSAGGAGGHGGQGGGGQGCGSPADCPTPPNECVVATCTQNLCGTKNVAAQTATQAQSPGDCKKAVCDGSGAIAKQNDDTDVPDDSNACTTDTCNAGTPTFTPVSAGTSCGTSLMCDATGHCIGCSAPADCGTDTDCRHFTCTASVCGHTDVADGTATSNQVTGDCKKNQCANGVAVSVNDGTDPNVDGKQCTLDVCTNGTPSNPPLMVGTGCNQNGGAKCDAMGDCVACINAGDCGTNTDCRTFTCVSGACQHADTAAGTATSTQQNGDCKENRCDGLGGVVVAALVTDLPVDGNACTDDICTTTVPSNPPTAIGVSCPTGVCDGASACVACNVDLDCGASTACQTNTCSNHTCMVANTPAGTAVGTQTAGDCHTKRCDGMGALVDVVDDTDVLNDGKECTGDVCTGGVASNPALGFDVACPVTTGHFCNGTGTCVECNSGPECASLVCSNNVCQGATCLDGQKNQDESDTDCGGTVCAKCTNGSTCIKNDDCSSGFCGSGFCAAPPVPVVSSTAPTDSATSVDPLSPIVITFSAAMNPSTLTTKTTLDAGPCTGSVQLSTDDFTTCLPLGAPTMGSGNTVATFVPGPALSYGSAYRIRVTTAATSAFGVALGSSFDQANGFLTSTNATVVNESGVAAEADYCVLQFPKTLTLAAGATSTDVFCQVYEPGQTEAAGPAGTFTVEMGYGPPSSNPEDQTGWSWFSTSFNVDVNNNDEYTTKLVAPGVAGDYRYACRVITTSGAITYCDADGSGSNSPTLGFEPTQLAPMTVN